MNSKTKPTYQQLVDTVKAYDKFIRSLINDINPTKEQKDKLMQLLDPLWSVDNIVAKCNEMSQSDEPTYEALVESLLALDDGWSDVFGQCCSNPVKNAWGENVDFTALNKGREVASGTIYKLRSSMKTSEAKTSEVKQTNPPKSGIQEYLENFDEHSFTDLMLRDLIDQEELRQSKNCPEVQSRDEIRASVERDFDYDFMKLAVMIAKALSYAAKGEV
ncbi:hypothetical protein HOS54_gp005 [Klebsiella phage Menlow]|uniref:DUF7181 domain-containing protein n=1 Tax=Klebsiella phage Menlow TaxID=2054273 RepID=A0A2H5BN04_9CAUD|nr:hypothetical protein HOS54_gp005 [Klebsiella phage Menlow]AUG87711.1 hypothetical protein CPT_Menlow_005 [Klebsiella phage Menlow]